MRRCEICGEQIPRIGNKHVKTKHSEYHREQIRLGSFELAFCLFWIFSFIVSLYPESPHVIVALVYALGLLFAVGQFVYAAKLRDLTLKYKSLYESAQQQKMN